MSLEEPTIKESNQNTVLVQKVTGEDLDDDVKQRETLEPIAMPCSQNVPTIHLPTIKTQNLS